MSKTLLSLALCILLPLSCLCPLAPPARAESVQHADLDGDGVEDEILCMADGAGLCLSVNGTGYTVPSTMPRSVCAGQCRHRQRRWLAGDRHCQ